MNAVRAFIPNKNYPAGADTSIKARRVGQMEISSPLVPLHAYIPRSLRLKATRSMASI